jgi:O-methyltransferase involved in polyketide biosynthesis
MESAAAVVSNRERMRCRQHIREQWKEGADMVVNLAAGLDTRPYRMDLSSSRLWVEVDLPDLLDYKEEVLKGESPR